VCDRAAAVKVRRSSGLWIPGSPKTPAPAEEEEEEERPPVAVVDVRLRVGSSTALGASTNARERQVRGSRVSERGQGDPQPTSLLILGNMDADMLGTSCCIPVSLTMEEDLIALGDGRDQILGCDVR
jgi:hypothetical protein